jgi:hypothetical protein
VVLGVGVTQAGGQEAQHWAGASISLRNVCSKVGWARTSSRNTCRVRETKWKEHAGRSSVSVTQQTVGPCASLQPGGVGRNQLQGHLCGFGVWVWVCGCVGGLVSGEGVVKGGQWWREPQSCEQLQCRAEMASPSDSAEYRRAHQQHILSQPHPSNLIQSSQTLLDPGTPIHTRTEPPRPPFSTTSLRPSLPACTPCCCCHYP